MSKKTSFLLLFLLFAGIRMLSAAPVDTTTAKRVAVNFCIRNQVTRVLGEGLTDATKEQFIDALTVVPAPAEFNHLYFLNAPYGFIIVSADDLALPVLGFSDEGNFSFEQLPENMRSWLTGYQREIESAVNQKTLSATEEVQREWSELTAATVTPMRDIQNVTPLLDTKWGQGDPYNAYCPYYNTTPPTYCVTGCVATAMAQVMKYWEYPTRGQGSHTYVDNELGGLELTADFENTCYTWCSMPDQAYPGDYSVAELMYDCGVSVDMHYNTAENGGSGASVMNCPAALINYFGYDDGYTYFIDKAYYTNSAWESMLQQELGLWNPIIYTGADYGGEDGHAFVCDGYNGNYFHFNWGWDGQEDGYYALGSLTPAGYNFSIYQGAVFCAPPDDWSWENMVCKNLSVSNTHVNCGEHFSLSVKISNNSSWPFSGAFMVVAMDADYNFTILARRNANVAACGTVSVNFNSLVLSEEGVFTLMAGYQPEDCEDIFPVIPLPNYTNGVTVSCTCNGTGIDENNAGEVSLYPNPAKEVLYLKVSEEMKNSEVILIDLTGKVIRRYDSVPSEISLEEVAPGIYFIQLHAIDGIITKKFVKE